MRILKSVLSSLVASLLLVSAVPATASTWSWSAPAGLSIAGQGAGSPQVIVDSTGLATAIWWGDNGENRIIQSSTSQSGGPWSTPVPISALGGDGAQPQLAVDSTGLVTAIWSRLSGSDYIIQSSTRPRGGSWSAPVPLSDPGQNAFYPQVVVDSTGSATAVWYRYVDTHYRIQASTRPLGGTWSAPFNLSPAGQSANDGKIGVDANGLVTAIWIRNSILQASNLPRGGSWSTPVNVSSIVLGRTASTPNLTVDSTGRAIAVWKGTDGSFNRVVQSSSSLQGAAWSTPSNVSTLIPFFPEVTVDSNGLATAVWSFDDGDKHIIQSSTSLNGAAWSTPVNLNATEDARDVKLTVNNNGLVTAVFSLYYGDRIQSTTSLNGAPWSTPVNLSDAGGSAEGQGVTVDGTGVATAIWLRNNGTHNVIQSSAFSAPPPPPSNEGSSEIVVAKPLVQAQTTQQPKVFGSATVSKILRVSKQSWTGNPAPKLSYQWYACSKEIEAADQKAPNSCKVIKGAKSGKLKLTANQTGKFVSVMVIGTSEGTTPTKLMSRSTARVS